MEPKVSHDDRSSFGENSAGSMTSSTLSAPFCGPRRGPAVPLDRVPLWLLPRLLRGVLLPPGERERTPMPCSCPFKQSSHRIPRAGAQQQRQWFSSDWSPLIISLTRYQSRDMSFVPGARDKI